MSEQLDLGVTPPVPDKNEGKPLTGRQQLAFDYVRERDGVTADEVGAWLHTHKGQRPHSVDERCDYCARDGNSVLRSKAVAPLVRYRLDVRLGRVYVARNPDDQVRDETAGGLIATSEPDPDLNPFAGL